MAFVLNGCQILNFRRKKCIGTNLTREKVINRDKITVRKKSRGKKCHGENFAQEKMRCTHYLEKGNEEKKERKKQRMFALKQNKAKGKEEDGD